MTPSVGRRNVKESEKRKKERLTSGLGTNARPGMVKQLFTVLKYCAMTDRRLRCLLPVLAVNLWSRTTSKKNKNKTQLFHYIIIIIINHNSSEFWIVIGQEALISFL